MSVKTWDDRWRKMLADAAPERRHGRVRVPYSPFVDLADWFERSRWNRVLVVGCGISAEPAILAWLGYEVVAIDFSSVAVEHLRSNPATREELAAWLLIRYTREDAFLDLSESLARLDDARREGGTLEIVCANFRDFTSPQPFDIVYCPWSWQCLDADDRRELPRRAFAWLARGGACRVATQNLQEEQSRELHEVFPAAGFFYRGRVAGADEAARVRLDAGEKMFDVYNASG